MNERIKQVTEYINSNYTTQDDRNKLMEYVNTHINDIMHYRACMPIISKVHGKVILKYFRELDMDLIEQNKDKYAYKKKIKKLNKKEKDKFNDSDIENIVELFNFIFGEYTKDSVIRFRNRETGEYQDYFISKILDKTILKSILNSNHFRNKNDMMYSLNTYTTMENCTEDNMFTVFSFAVDLDFKEVPKYADNTSKQIIKLIRSKFSKSIPEPSIIEHGNNIRLIYVVEPIIATNKVIGLISKVNKIISKELKDYGASPQPLTTYGRIPGSINTKNNKKINVIYNNKIAYSIDSLKELLPTKEENQKAKGKIINLGDNFSSRANFFKYNKNRIEDLFKIVQYFNGEFDGKKYIFYQVRNHCFLAGMDTKATDEKLEELYDMFINPQPYHHYERDTRNVERKQYLYNAQTILDEIGIDTELEVKLNLKVLMSQSEYKRRENIRVKAIQRAKYRNEEGLTKSEVKRRDLFISIARLEVQGLSRKSISKELNIDLSNMQKKIKKQYNKINYLEILSEVKQGFYYNIRIVV